MKIRQDMFKRVLARSIDSWPLRRELFAVRHFIYKDDRKVKVGLDLGFTHAGVSQIFRQLGGYWVSAEFTRERGALVASVLGSEQVVVLGPQGDIPFEEKQFDTVVVANGSVFFDGVTLEMLIKECHRVMDNGGLLVITLPRRKPVALARLLGGRRGRVEARYACSERELFTLLKSGFDVLGVKFSGRFWVELLRQMLEKEGFAGNCSVPEWLERFLYRIASVLDLPLFLTRRYNVTVCGRRKGWRGKQRGLMNDHTSAVSNAMFYDRKNRERPFSATRYR
ncbi:MAG: methyltransferase domain-containing protein [Kiritimatiellae bacterium]|nr:methyltransferase domain-containing protein [Kiritimatiellia bacterium]